MLDADRGLGQPVAVEQLPVEDHERPAVSGDPAQRRVQVLSLGRDDGDTLVAVAVRRRPGDPEPGPQQGQIQRMAGRERLNGMGSGEGIPWYRVLVRPKEGVAMALSASEARKRLFPLIEQVNDDEEAVEIVSKSGTAFLVPEQLWRSLVETRYLLRSPANARRLLDSVARVEAGEFERHDLISDAEETERQAS